MIDGQNYKLSGYIDTDIAMGMEHKIIEALFNIYFASLHDRNDSRCDHDMNSAIYATCRMVFAEAGITDQVLDIFEHIFPVLEAGQ